METHAWALLIPYDYHYFKVSYTEELTETGKSFVLHMQVQLHYDMFHLNGKI